MRDDPDGGELLEIARKILREDILPTLDPAKRYDALMIANAIAIARRQMHAGGAPAAFELERLQELLGVSGDPVSLNRELARRIRRGDFAPACADHARLHAFLSEITRQKVRESNPKYLSSFAPRDPDLPRGIRA